ncbi:hypothetical protein GCM10009634_01380 [Saccharothrix xinjiangensis]
MQGSAGHPDDFGSPAFAAGQPAAGSSAWESAGRPEDSDPSASAARSATGSEGAVQGGADEPGSGSTGAVQGGAGQTAFGSAGGVQGAAGRTTSGVAGAVQGGAGHTPSSSAGVAQGDPGQVAFGPAGAVQGGAGQTGFGSAGVAQGDPGQASFGSAGVAQGGAGQTAFGSTGAVQGGVGRTGTGSFGAAQGGAGVPGTGAGAWQGGFHPGQPGPHGVPQTHAAADHGSPSSTPSGPAQPSGPGQPGSPGGPGPYYALPGSVVPAPRRGRGKVVAGVAALVLAVGGVAGGVGGYLGYEAAEQSGPVVNALNQVPPAQQTNSSPDGSIEQVAAKVLPTVVQVQVQGGAGSGFVLSSDGLVLTNNHVVESAANGGAIRVLLQDGRSFDARMIGRDPTSDLAVVKAEGVTDLPVAELGNSGDLRIGQQVVAVGSPFDLNGTVTSGIVSSLNRPVSAGSERGGQATVLNAIQTDAAINPGNSGGPLVDMRGRVIGINSAIYSPNTSQSQAGSVGIGFAIPIDQARRTATELSETGKATQTVLGVQVTDAAEGGAQVSEVTSGSAAASAGIQDGDVITKFGDRPIDSSDALVAAVRSRAPGDKVQLTTDDGRTVEVTLGGQTVEVR